MLASDVRRRCCWDELSGRDKLGDILAELLDLLDLAGDLGSEGLLERLYRRVSMESGMQRQIARVDSAYSALGRVGAESLSHGGGSGHGGAQGGGTNSHRGHYDGCRLIRKR